MKTLSLALSSSHQLVGTPNTQTTGKTSHIRKRTRHSPTMKIQSTKTYRRWISLESGSKEKTRSGREGSFRRRRNQRRSKTQRPPTNVEEKDNQAFNSHNLLNIRRNQLLRSSIQRFSCNGGREPTRTTRRHVRLKSLVSSNTLCNLQSNEVGLSVT
ncbi:hypothetical protein YC2023_042251 [Brassica napus]